MSRRGSWKSLGIANRWLGTALDGIPSATGFVHAAQPARRELARTTAQRTVVNLGPQTPTSKVSVPVRRLSDNSGAIPVLDAQTLHGQKVGQVKALLMPRLHHAQSRPGQLQLQPISLVENLEMKGDC